MSWSEYCVCGVVAMVGLPRPRLVRCSWRLCLGLVLDVLLPPLEVVRLSVLGWVLLDGAPLVVLQFGFAAPLELLPLLLLVVVACFLVDW